MADHEPRAKRARVDKAGRFAALEKLKQLKGSKNKCEVNDEVDNVYEIVDEREYAKKAREKYGGDWIEDDGTGYAEDGRDFFEDEDEFSSDGEESTKKQSKKKDTKKRPRDNDKPAKGKSSIRNLFKNAVPKKQVAVNLADDDVLADILGELNESPKVKPLLPRGGPAGEMVADAYSASTTTTLAPAKIAGNPFKKQDAASLAKDYMSSFINNIKIKEKTKKPEETSDDELLESILKPKSVEASKRARPTEPPSTVVSRPQKPIAENKIKPALQQESATSTSTAAKDTIDFPEDDDLDFSCLQEDENQFDIEKAPQAEKNKAKDDIGLATSEDIAAKAIDEEDDMHKMLQNWERICEMNNFEEEINAKATDDCDLSKENLRFWYWEAWEDPNKRPGEIFLFGRTSEGKSVCVRVENINRVLYLLPREYLLDPITKEPTKQKVTLADLYKEFDEEISEELKLGTFRTRKVTKNFAYHPIGFEVPQVCDYMEIHYDGRKPPLDSKRKYNSIAHVFGTNTTSLETFLLERKIKGPCWLTLKQFKENITPMSWCKTELLVSDPRHVLLADDLPKPQPPPPLTLLTLNVRTALNPKTLKNEICMISMLVHNRFHIDRPAPQPAFNRHMCGLTRPPQTPWPFDLASKLSGFKSTRLYKHDSERSLLSWFLAQYQQVDADLIVSFDLFDCQLDVITDRIVALQIHQWSRLGRLRMSQHSGKKLLDYFVGRMVCDVKNSAKECLRSRSYDLQTLSCNVLKIKENERMDVTNEQLMAMYESGDGILKLITLTMQDASYVLRLMCDLNIMPLALQITNICGNTMTRTLQGGRSERNEFLLLHAFTEKNYIVPDKRKREWSKKTKSADGDETEVVAPNRKKAAYSGGLVLDPIKGLYEKYVLLMDFNSLYPSIIQEYNICFTTVQKPYNADDLAQLPDSSAEPGILPQQLRRLVESRREVKKLMAAPDLTPELRLQYHIRQMALKLTANSMYGCLGFDQSRFFAQHLASLVTHKGREILMNTKSVVQKMNYEVVYGDTDSIMVNTNITDYDQVFKIGHGIKQSINKLYKQLELDIDGVFSVLLLLKKKKYAAVKVSKTGKGDLKKEIEIKGLDIVRRDWSQIAVSIGNLVIEEILSERQLDEKIDIIHSHLERVKNDLLSGSVPLPIFVITKQLSKAPNEFKNATSMPHVQVAQRMNTTRNRRFKRGDMIDYIICDDGTANPAMQRAYHLDELKGSEHLKVDVNYYLAHQIHPVVTRMVDVLEGTDASRIAECLGLDPTKFRAAVQRSHQERSEDATGESLIKTNLQKYRQCDKFKFVCVACKTEQIMASAFKPASSSSTAAGHNTYDAVLEKCSNPQCTTAPYQYVASIRNQLVLSMRDYITRFYQNWLVCDDPACNYNTRSHGHVMQGNRPVCLVCKNGCLIRQYTERDLYTQLSYFQFMFDLSRHQQKNVSLSSEAEAAYHVLRETVDQQLDKSAYCSISLASLFAHLKCVDSSPEVTHKQVDLVQVATSLDDV